MAKFNAATAVEALDFDFTAYEGPSGTIPEPSSGMVKKFFKELRAIATEAQRRFAELERDATPPEVSGGKVVTEEDQTEAENELTDTEAMETLVSMTEEQAEEWNARAKASIVEVCSNAFTADDLDKLPYRVQRAFQQWLSEQLRPEEQTPATKS